MHQSILTLSLLSALASHVSAAPAPRDVTNPTNFLLVTTSQCTPNTNSSLLANVNATSLFDPYQQNAFLLRLIGPGYGSLPTFNLTDGVLHTLTEGNELDGFGLLVYNSTTVVTGGDLQFLPESEEGGNLGLVDGYLLGVGGDVEGWTICEGELGESVISWKGANSTCIDTYIQAMEQAPYK